MSHPPHDDSDLPESINDAPDTTPIHPISADPDASGHNTPDDDDAPDDDHGDKLDQAADDPPCSESRFDALLDVAEAVRTIVSATREYATTARLAVRVPGASEDAPLLNRSAGFRYADQYAPFTDALRKGEQVAVSTVVQDGSLVAFGLGEVPTREGVEIMTIDVAQSGRRSAGTKSTVAIDGQSFEIGIGHVLVLSLIESISARPLHTYATTAPARYIFKSLGFVSLDDENACRLQLTTSQQSGPVSQQ